MGFYTLACSKLTKNFSTSILLIDLFVTTRHHLAFKMLQLVTMPPLFFLTSLLVVLFILNFIVYVLGLYSSYFLLLRDLYFE